jgi:acyl carrier protein
MKTAIEIVLVISAVVAAMIVGFRAVRRRERREVARFEELFHMEAQDYVAAMGFKAGTHEAEAALKLRSIIAEYGWIRPESVLPEHRFWEYKNLPSFDSPDTVELIMEIESQFGVNVPDEAVEVIMADVFDYKKDITVKEMTFRFLAFLQGLEKKDAKWTRT